MNTLYLVDGFGGSPEINWLSNLEKCYKDSFDTKKVKYTNSNVADVKVWDEDLDRNIYNPQNAYFICHSLGCITLLRYILRNNIRIKGAIFVSGFAESIVDYPQFDDYMKNIDLEKIKHLVGISFVISARTDRIIDWQITNNLSHEMEIPFILLPDGGHFTSTEGVIEMPSVKSVVNTFWQE